MVAADAAPAVARFSPVAAGFRRRRDAPYVSALRFLAPDGGISTLRFRWRRTVVVMPGRHRARPPFGYAACMAFSQWSPERRRLVAWFGGVIGALCLAFFWKRDPPPSAVGHACHVMTFSVSRKSSRGSSLVPIELEDGGTHAVAGGTACVVLEERGPRTLIRITDGILAGTTGWVPRGAVEPN